jgi:hypothetical protein
VLAVVIGLVAVDAGAPLLEPQLEVLEPDAGVGLG